MAKNPNLFVQTAFLGDLLLSIPTLRWLRKEIPGEIELVCRKGFGGFFQGLGLVDHYIEVDKNSALSRFDLKTQLRQKEYNVVICPHQSFSSAKLVGGVQARQKIGYQKWWNWPFFTTREQRLLHLPESVRQLWLLKSLAPELNTRLSDYLSTHQDPTSDIDSCPGSGDFNEVPDWGSMSCRDIFDNAHLGKTSSSALLNPLAAVREDYHHMDKGDQDVFLIAPGSVWGTKRWTIQGYQKLAKELSERGLVLLVGSKGEHELCQEIQKGAPRAINNCGSSLMETSFYMYFASALITNDCGAMHLASMVGLPTVSVFGPTVLEFGYRPWQNRAIVVQNKSVSCRPCGKHGPQVCPIGTHECMESISVQQVLSALSQVRS